MSMDYKEFSLRDYKELHPFNRSQLTVSENASGSNGFTCQWFISKYQKSEFCFKIYEYERQPHWSTA